MIIRNKSFTTTKPFYLIATPIGNLEEISIRVINTLKEVDFIACEDTRVTGQLLKHLNISKPLLSVHEFNEKAKSDLIISKLNEGLIGAYMSDAGYPLISDPGAIIVKNLIYAGFKVSVINGPSALLPALVGSGIDASHFYFHGFIEQKISKDQLLELFKRHETMIFYEAPHRIEKTLQLIAPYAKDRNSCLVREISKLHEEYNYGTINELLTLDFTTIRGELVLVVEGNKDKVSNNELEIDLKLSELIKDGYKLKEAIKILAHFYDINKNSLYKKHLEKNKE